MVRIPFAALVTPVSLAVVVALLPACGGEEPGAAPSAASVASPAPSASTPSASAAPQTSASTAPGRAGEPDVPTPLTKALEHVRAIATTTWRLYALHDDATLTSWDARGVRAPKTEVLGPIRELVAANDTVCTLAVAGSVSCKKEWPWSLASANDPAVPDAAWTDIGLANVVAIAGRDVQWVKSDGESHPGPLWFAVLADGSVKVFELAGDEPTVAVRNIPGVAKARAVAAGDDHACAIVEGGRVVCWHHLLSVASSDDRGPRPTTVEKLSSIDDAFAASGPCIRRKRGPLTCLVRDDSWSEARARGRRARLEPAPGAAHIHSTFRRTCLVYDDGQAECTKQGSLPTTHVIDIALGVNHACALGSEGKVLCERE